MLFPPDIIWYIKIMMVKLKPIKLGELIYLTHSETKKIKEEMLDFAHIASAETKSDPFAMTGLYL